MKLPVLKQLWREFQATSLLRKDFETFCAGVTDWLDDYALFMALKDTYPAKTWNQWPEDLVRREPGALERARRDLGDLVSFHQFTQFAFYRQWCRLKGYAHERGIRVVGDIPFYVSFDSADVWTNPQNFALDPKTHQPRLMAGVPPDFFSATGQLWGNPVYDWKHLEQEGFKWWVRRFQRLAKLVDVVRIDHFRGFQAFWQVPHGETTAINGTWAECPGDEFFHTLEHELGHLPVWAEDLGLVTPQVEKLRDDFDFPGMKVLQFAFDETGAESPYLPFNFPFNCVCYTGHARQRHHRRLVDGSRRGAEETGADIYRTRWTDPLGDDPSRDELHRRQRCRSTAGRARARFRCENERARPRAGQLVMAIPGQRVVR